MQATPQSSPGGHKVLRYTVNIAGRNVTRFVVSGEEPGVGVRVYEMEVDAEASRAPQEYLFGPSSTSQLKSIAHGETAARDTLQPRSPLSTLNLRATVTLGGSASPSSTFRTPVDLASEEFYGGLVAAAATAPVNMYEHDNVEHPARPSTRLERLKKRFTKLVK
jgi:hypothetical protein